MAARASARLARGGTCAKAAFRLFTRSSLIFPPDHRLPPSPRRQRHPRQLHTHSQCKHASSFPLRLHILNRSTPTTSFIHLLSSVLTCCCPPSTLVHSSSPFPYFFLIPQRHSLFVVTPTPSAISPSSLLRHGFKTAETDQEERPRLCASVSITFFGPGTIYHPFTHPHFLFSTSPFSYITVALRGQALGLLPLSPQAFRTLDCQTAPSRLLPPAFLPLAILQSRQLTALHVQNVQSIASYNNYPA